ncbi:MAG TPA: class I SAM-dependent methyltransferase, partial [Candidatus Dormibacteraeota bacterium]|nr:class I SAM-dependent methyltransferase [Candidatus Dormibacteraeota bacterium]
AAEQVPQPTAILDVGCGTGRLLRSAQARFAGARFDGVDPAPGMVEQARASSDGINFQLGSAEKLSHPDAAFDLVFSTMTFHHWADQQRSAAEVARVLRTGGRWILADFVATGVMAYVTRLFRVTQFPQRGRLDAMLARAGLRVVAERRVRAQIQVLAIAR